MYCKPQITVQLDCVGCQFVCCCLNTARWLVMDKGRMDQEEKKEVNVFSYSQ